MEPSAGDNWKGQDQMPIILSQWLTVWGVFRPSHRCMNASFSLTLVPFRNRNARDPRCRSHLAFIPQRESLCSCH
ncbi:hypothetical protein BDV32DRAFT_116492 [Aspergillus pseudonomiae]|nr:hypothetical protein BDV32DRAFT_116492 [Aspergillus pseudonomiae]